MEICIYMYILSYVCTYHMYDTYVYILYDIRGTRIPSMNTALKSKFLSLKVCFSSKSPQRKQCLSFRSADVTLSN